MLRLSFHFVVLCFCGQVFGLRVSEGKPSGVETEMFELHNFSGDGQRARVVFVAGIEGAGHHLVDAFLERITHREVTLPHSWACRPHGSIWREEDTAKMTEIFRNLTVSTLWTFPSAFSYPCHGFLNETGRREHQPFHPRVDWIREAAVAANVDLQVLLVVRSMADTLAADCLHRNFEPCYVQADVLNFNGRAMIDQLRAVPRNTMSCFVYGKHHQMQESLKHSMRYSGNLLDEVWHEMKWEDSRDQEPHWVTLVQSLKELGNDLWTLCKSATA